MSTHTDRDATANFFLQGALAKARTPENDGHTYWNGEPAECRVVRVIVGPSPRPSWWCAEMVGQEREAVEVRYAGQPPFYLDNEAGIGWDKVTIGRGWPDFGHRSLPVERLVVPATERVSP